MVLTDRQRNDLHSGIYEYLRSRPGDAFQRAADALAEADPDACESNGEGGSNSITPLLEKKWTAIPRLQKKVLELERQAAQSARIHAHRSSATSTAITANAGGGSGGGDVAGGRRMLPRMPCQFTLQGHSLVVTSVAVHPVFTVAVSGSEDGTIKAWDHESGEYMKTMKGHTNTVNSVAFSPTGTYLVSCSTDLSIKLWDFSTYVCLRTLRGHDHTISSARFLPKLDIPPSTSPDSGSVTGVEASVAGANHVVSASRDATVKLWDIETGFCDHTFTDHSDWVRVLAVRQSDGGCWASAGNDQTIFVYDGTKNLAAELRGHTHVVESLAFVIEEPLRSGGRERKEAEANRDLLVSGSRDRTVRLWKISEAACLNVFNAHENWVRSVILHPSGNYIISCADDKTIRIFDVKANRCLRTLEKAHNHFVTCIDMHHTLPIMVSGSVDQTVRCWQLD